MAGGILWVVATSMFAGIREQHGTGEIRFVVQDGIEVPRTPELQRRHERIETIHLIEQFLTWGAAIYAMLGLRFLFIHPVATLSIPITSANIFLMSILIISWAKTCANVIEARGYRIDLAIQNIVEGLILPHRSV
jgi:hypothetical protein